VGHKVHFGASEKQNGDGLYFMLGWVRCNFHNKRAWTRYNEHVFLHPVGSVGHVVPSIATEMRNIDVIFSYSGGLGSVSLKSALGHITPNLCFCILWDLRVM
jgi:hypothetical protein